jgi:hypothetical protein
MNDRAVTATRQPYWRRLIRVEASGVRTAAAAALPLFVGQLLGYPVIGLMVGLGGLYLSVTDKEGSTPTALLVAIACNAIAALAGNWIGHGTWLSIISMFVVALLGGMASAYGEVPSQIGFIATLVFAVSVGMSAGFKVGVESLLEFVLGGLWGMALTLLLWRFERQTGEQTDPGNPDPHPPLKHTTWSKLIKRFTSNLTFHSIIFRHAMRIAIASTIAVALFKILHIDRGYWLIITVLVIVKPVFADTRKRAMQRVIGSVIGGAIAAVLAATIHNVLILDALLVVFSVLAYSHVNENYTFFTLFLTPFIVLMIDIVQPSSGWHLAFERIVNTLIGAAVALVVTFLFRPKSSFRRSRAARSTCL